MRARSSRGGSHAAQGTLIQDPGSVLPARAQPERTAATLATMASCAETLMMGSTDPVDIQMGTVLAPSCGTVYL